MVYFWQNILAFLILFLLWILTYFLNWVNKHNIYKKNRKIRFYRKKDYFTVYFMGLFCLLLQQITENSSNWQEKLFYKVANSHEFV